MTLLDLKTCFCQKITLLLAARKNKRLPIRIFSPLKYLWACLPERFLKGMLTFHGVVVVAVGVVADVAAVVAVAAVGDVVGQKHVTMGM